MSGRWQLILILLCCALASVEANGQWLSPDCGSLTNAFGPFDYTDPRRRADLEIVEVSHFDRGVESLRGHASHPITLSGDLDYTLRAFPNHHRALYAMARYNLTKKDYKRRAMRYTPECYFERAMAFSQKDGTIRMIFGIYLYKMDRLDESTERFRQAVELSPKSAELHYNLGLVLADKKEYEEAKRHAEIAYELGHPMPGLRNKLKRAGAW